MTTVKNEISALDDIALKNMSGAGVGMGIAYIGASIGSIGLLAFFDGVHGFPIAKSNFSSSKS